MAEQILKTKIKLLVRSYEEWAAKDDVLLKGEVGFCTIEPLGDPGTNNNAAWSAPTVLFKVGTYDGVNESTKKKFSELKWASALAADVHTWAKMSEKDFLDYLEEKVKNTSLTNYYTKAEVDALLLTNSTNDKAYADGVAATAKSEAIAAAAADATTKAGTAEANAKAHAESFANNLNNAMDLRVDALEEHKDDYKDYADKAEADAIATAAADATAKAGAAESAAKAHAEEKVNALANGAVAANATAIATEKGRAEGEEARIEGLLDAYKTSNNAALDAVRQTAEAARTEDEVNGQIDAKITALNLATTYEPIGAEDRAKAYVDQKIGDADLGQYTTEQEVKDIVDTVIAGAVDGDTITGLANLVEYLHTHGGEAAEMGAAIDVLEGKVETIEGKPAYGITAGQISNWDGEVGAKALAGTKLDATTFTNYENAHKNDYTNAQVDAAIDADVAKAIEDEVARANGAYDAKGAAADAQAAAIADAAGKYETIGTAQGIVDGLKLGETYEPIGAENRAVATANGYTDEKVGALANGQVKTNKEAIEAINHTTTGIYAQAKAYADGLAVNYATAAQGVKADNALQEIEVGTGLKVSDKADNKQRVEIDDTVIFILDCNY